MKNLFTLGLTLSLLFCIGCTPHADKPDWQIEVASVGMNAGSLSAHADFATVGSLYHSVSLWRTSDKERIFNWSHKPKQNTLLVDADFTPSNEWAITADTTTLVLWRITTGVAERYWQAPGEILSAKITPDGRYALLGLSDHTAVLFDAVKGGVARTLHHDNRVRSVAISGDGKHALTGSEDYTAIFWDLNSGKALSKVQHNDDVQLVELSNDGQIAFSVSKYDRALLWNTKDGSIIGELPLKAEFIKRGLRFSSARFSDDNQLLLTGRPDQIVSLWKIANFTEIQRWKIPKRKAWKPQGAAILDVAFDKENKNIFALSSNGFLSYLKRN